MEDEIEFVTPITVDTSQAQYHRPYVCSKHGERGADMVFDNSRAYCSVCIEVLFQAHGLQPMEIQEQEG